MKGENQPLIIIGVSLAALAVVAFVTESEIVTNCVFAFGIIFVVLTVYRLTRPGDEPEMPGEQGAAQDTERPQGRRRKPRRRRGPKGP